MMKLDVHKKQRMNAMLTRDKATLVAKINACDEATYERPDTHAVKLRSNELAVKR